MYKANPNLNLTDYEESVYVEYSTTSSNHMVLYNGSDQENIVLGFYNNYIIVSGISSKVFAKPADYNNGEKHSLFVTYKDGEFELYYDGEKQEPIDRNDYWSRNSNTYIGVHNGNDCYFVGNIYQVRVFDSKISYEDVPNAENMVIYLNPINISSGNYYVNNNIGIDNSVAHSYVKYDLTNVNENKYLYINYSISSDSPDKGYIIVNDDPNTPSTSTTAGRYLYTSGVAENQSVTVPLFKNKVNYVHFMYSKDWGYYNGTDTFIINSIKLYDKYSSEELAGTSTINTTDTSESILNLPIAKLNEEPSTVVMLKDVSLTNKIEIPEQKSMILDLNGHTLSTTANDYMIVNNGDLTITDGKYADEIADLSDRFEEEIQINAEKKAIYDEKLAEYEEYAGLCEGCEPSDEYKLDHLEEYADYFGLDFSSVDFDYKGEEDDYQVPLSGRYKLEVWGAQGGSVNNSYVGGYGSYSVGEVNLTKDEHIYINVGGQGTSSKNSVLTGGYNGGGSSHGADCGIYTNRYGASGGGATSIATVSGELKDLDESTNIPNLLIIAGGGGGAVSIDNWMVGSGGSAGGFVGLNGSHPNHNGHGAEQYSQGGTQTAGGAGGQGWEDFSDVSDETKELTAGKFGLGGSSPTWECSEGGAGGGGLYGGGGGAQSSGAGGSGYIGNELLSNKKMVCYNCTIDDSLSTKTERTTCVNATANADCAKKNNGYARITLLAADEYLEELRNNLTKTYSVKEKPTKDYYEYESGKFVIKTTSEYFTPSVNNSNNRAEIREDSLYFSSTANNASSLIYYNNKLTKTSISGTYRNYNNGSGSGTLYIGFARTPNNDSTDYVSYKRFGIGYDSSPINFNVKYDGDDEVYFKIIQVKSDGNVIYSEISNLYFDIYSPKNYKDLMGNITSSTNNIMLNNSGAELTLDGPTINVNKEGASGVVNKGKLNYTELTTFNVNGANYAKAILNDTNGDLADTTGKINVIGSTSYGVFDRSNDSLIENLHIQTSNSNNVAIIGRNVGNVTYNNLNIYGSGVGINNNSDGDLIINNSSLSSTGNDAIYSWGDNTNYKLIINSSNIYSLLNMDYANRFVYINNSNFSGTRGNIRTLHSVLNIYKSNFENLNTSNDSSVNIYNGGTMTIKDSYLTGPYRIIYNSYDLGRMDVPSFKSNAYIINTKLLGLHQFIIMILWI